MNFYDLPENVQYNVFKTLFSETVLSYMKHKDWWFHTVKCRANIGQYKMPSPHYIDAEISGGAEFFF